MGKKVAANGSAKRPDAGALESLYVEFVKQFYEKQNHKRAEQLAPGLEKALAESPEYARSIRGEEVRSLLAELRGDFKEAARSREAEIRKILQLHALAVNTPSWDYVARQYDFSDVSDRLDLLAMLYDEQGEGERAIRILQESKQYCQAHAIPFDAQDLLDELEQALTAAAKS